MTEEEFMSLKKGDIVWCTHKNSEKFSHYVYGEMYELRNNPKPGDSLMTVSDSNGSKTNGWSHQYFDIEDPNGPFDVFDFIKGLG